MDIQSNSLPLPSLAPANDSSIIICDSFIASWVLPQLPLPVTACLHNFVNSHYLDVIMKKSYPKSK